MDSLMVAYEIAGILAACVAVLAGAAGFMRWSNARLGARILDEIRVATYPISPTANGGRSLPDVARKIEVIEKDLLAVKGQIDLLVRIYTEEGN